VLAYAFKNEADFSRLVIGLAVGCVVFLVLLERYILFRVEWNVSRHCGAFHNVIILGTDSVAAHLARTLKREAMLRLQVVGFLRTDLSEADPEIPPAKIRGTVEELRSLIQAQSIRQVILADSRLGHDKIVDILLLCERNLITFNMVPDLFRIMTSSMDVQSLDDIPLLGSSRWPLDHFWNRAMKRMEDIAGAIVGLILSAPVIAIAAILIKRESPGPVFYVQERCGERGRPFRLFKLRTMRPDAETQTGPVWATPNDPRTTRIGAFLRGHNLDELPQLWNVLQGDMSLVGPRPERPHFVNKFREDIDRYMSRHVARPGMTGWAQVNGLRGNTSIQERIKYDLYYLENWSLALDFKILLRTVLARDNAY
jgi:exopolysaccharide biosynthesis polyprenyl glycosylphosphotransferase